MATTEGWGLYGGANAPLESEGIGSWFWRRQKETDGFDLNLMKSVFVASWRLLVCQPFAASSDNLQCYSGL
jgi:hypothetical protein